MKKWEKPILKNAGVEQTEVCQDHYYCLKCGADLGTDKNAKCPIPGHSVYGTKGSPVCES